MAFILSCSAFKTSKTLRTPICSSAFVPSTALVEDFTADSFIDEITGANYYKLHVDLNEDAKSQGVDLQTGMPAEVYITTGEKTLLSYLLDPINSTIRKSFREN